MVARGIMEGENRSERLVRALLRPLPTIRQLLPISSESRRNGLPLLRTPFPLWPRTLHPASVIGAPHVERGAEGSWARDRSKGEAEIINVIVAHC